MLILPQMVEFLFGSKLKKMAAREERLIQQCQEIVRQMQIEKLNKLLLHFVKFDFYKKLLGAHGCVDVRLDNINEIDRLPIMTKQIIISNFDMLSARSEANYITSTSGSTGVNIKFCHCKGVQAAKRMALIVMYRWMGVDFFTDRKLAVWGVHPGAKWTTKLMEHFKALIKNGKVICAFGLDERKSMKFLRDISDYKPKLITAYPNYAYDLAMAGLKYHLEPPRSLRAIVLSGEMIYDFQVEAIERFFKCKVYRRYGSREFGNIAHECRYGGSLHVIPSRFYLENGADGELLVTDLDNLATPFIRYQIGDIGQVSAIQCKCGFQHQSILNIQGRSHDVIRTKTGKQVPGQFWTVLSRCVPGIKQFQVVQRNLEAIDFNIITTKDYRDSEAHKLFEALKKVAGDEFCMNINKVDSIIPSASGKHKYIIKL